MLNAYEITDRDGHASIVYAKSAAAAKADKIRTYRDCGFETWKEALAFIASCRRVRSHDPVRRVVSADLSDDDRHVLLHSIGEWDGRPVKGLPFRNRYNEPDGTKCLPLVERGYMTQNPRNGHYFHVSAAGFAALGLTMPPEVP